MNGDARQGFGNGRDWELEESGTETFEWTIDPQHGLIQGPLDLGFLRGHRMALNLAPEQVALLVEGRRLHAVYLDGGHILDIGNGDGQVPAACRLIFVTLGRGLEAAWTREDPVDLGADVNVIGRVIVTLASPGRFFETFLAGLESWDEAFLVRLVRQRAHAALTAVLADVAPSPAHLQARLTHLDPSDLDEELAPCGLACAEAALYTAAGPVEEGSPTEAGQFTTLQHN
jgi:hypothetical protein